MVTWCNSILFMLVKDIPVGSLCSQQDENTQSGKQLQWVSQPMLDQRERVVRSYVTEYDDIMSASHAHWCPKSHQMHGKSLLLCYFDAEEYDASAEWNLKCAENFMHQINKINQENRRKCWGWDVTESVLHPLYTIYVSYFTLIPQSKYWWLKQ